MQPIHRSSARAKDFTLGTISRKEWLWVALGCLVIMALTGFPYVMGFSLSSTDMVFSGSIIAVEDGNTYLAAMRQGAAGDWVFHIPYTPEPHRGGAVFIFYILLGKLAALTGVTLPWMLHAARLMTTPLLLAIIYRFIAFFTPWVYLRRLGFVLAGTGAGLGWLWVALGQPFGPGNMPIDLWVPDAFAFLTIFTFPHLILAQALILQLVTNGLQLTEHSNWQRTLRCVLLGLILSAIHPYSLPLVLVLLGLYWAWRRKSSWREHWLSLFQLVAVGLVSMPYLLYSLWLFAANPVFHSWQQQNRILSPNPIHYLLGYGIIGGLALIGLLYPHTWRRLRQGQFLVLWLLLVPVFLYLPSNLQRRFLDGYQLPVLVMALAGLLDVLRTLPPRWRRRSVTLLVVISTFTNILLLTGAAYAVAARTPLIFIPRPAVKAAHWLDSNVPKDSIVLAAYDTGNMLPAYASVRTFVGHGPQSMDADHKRQLVSEFFSSMSSAQRKALLVEYDVDYLFYGPNECDLGGFSPSRDSIFVSVYHNQAITIFRVVGEESK